MGRSLPGFVEQQTFDVGPENNLDMHIDELV
jgi:hypothetical protein